MLFFFKQKTAYEMRISDWSSDVCSSDLPSTLSCQLERAVRISTGNCLPSSRSCLTSSMPDILGRPRSMMPTSNGTSRPMYRPSSPSWAASTAKPSRFSRAASVSRNGASSSTRRIRIGYSSVMMCEGNRARSMCSLWKLGSSVVVTACRRAAPRLRVVHVDADTAAIVHHLDAIDAASVGLHALGVDPPAPGAALDPPHRVSSPVVAERDALLMPPWLGCHCRAPGLAAPAFDALAPCTTPPFGTPLVLALCK